MSLSKRYITNKKYFWFVTFSQMFTYCSKLIWWWRIRKWPLFFKVLRFSELFRILAQFAKMEICTPNGTLKFHFFATHVKTKFKVYMKDYLLAIFRMHHFISVGCRKLANIRKCMQIRKSFVQNNSNFCLLPNFFAKMTPPQPVKCSISNFWYYLTHPTVHLLSIHSHMFAIKVPKVHN